MPEDHFSTPYHHDDGHARSRPLSPDGSRDLLVSIEQMGVESALVRAHSAPPMGAEEVGRADQKALARPARRVIVGAAVGAAVALAVGVVVMLIADLDPAPVILMSLFIGTILGGLWSLYGRLLANVEAPDTESGLTIVEVDLGPLEPEQAAEVRELVDHAGRPSPGPGGGPARSGGPV